MKKYWRLKLIEQLIELNKSKDETITMMYLNHLKIHRNLIKNSYKAGFKEGIKFAKKKQVKELKIFIHKQI